MMMFGQVGEFVNDEIFNNLGRSHNEPPVQANCPAGRTTAPSSSLVPKFEVLVFETHPLGVVVGTVGKVVPRPAPVEIFENLLDRGLFDGALPEPNRILVYLMFLSWFDNEFTVLTEEWEALASLERAVRDLLTVGLVIPLSVYDPRRVFLE